MNSDSFFTIGSTHQICQDYAMAEGDVVVLSDGCSSALNSDWGARLLTRTCFIELKKEKPKDLQPFLLNVLDSTYKHVQSLQLNDDCLAATLLGIYVKDDIIHTFITGDGYIVARNKKDKSLTVLGWNYSTNAPYYLFYNLNKELKQSYYDHFGGETTLERFVLDNGVLKEEELLHKPIFDNDMVLFPVEEYDLVAVLSDGLSSFTQQKKEKTSILNSRVYIEDVLKDLFQFKTLDGQFARRRCQWFLKEYLNKNIRHTDDFSIGILNI